MPGIHINDLKANTGAFARAYMFNIYFEDAPVAVNGGENKVAYLVRSSSLPESTIDPIEVPWQGQTYKIGSTHTFAEWECTFNIDKDSDLRKRMLDWQSIIHDPATNEQSDPQDYFGTAKIELLDVKGDPKLTYILHQLWPSSVGAADLAHDSKEVLQMSVTFNYNWHTHE